MTRLVRLLKFMDKLILKGSVIYATVPFPEGNGKKARPVVVLTLPNIYNDVVVAEIVTRPRPDVLPIQDTSSAGVFNGSGVRMRLCTINLGKNVRPIGRLSTVDYKMVKERVQAMLL